MGDDSSFKTRAWLIELMEKTQIATEDIGSRGEAFIDGKEDPRMDELGLDSLSLMQLCIDIEDEVGVQLSVETISSSKTLGQVLEVINRSIAAQSG